MFLLHREPQVKIITELHRVLTTQIMKKLLLLFLIILSFTGYGKTDKDTVFKTYHLKGGYTLKIQTMGRDSNATVLIKGKDKNVLNSAEKYDGLDVLGYVYADYDSTYIMMTHVGAQPVTFEVIDKVQAQTILYGQSPILTRIR